MIKLKRITTAALAAVMLMPTLNVGATDNADVGSVITESEVLYQETFSNWDASTWNDKTAAPGMVLANLDITGATSTGMSNIKP